MRGVWRIEKLYRRLNKHLQTVAWKGRRPVNINSSILRIRPDDTFIVSYPRSGSAWLRRLLATILDPDQQISVLNIDDYYVPDIYKAGSKLETCHSPRLLKSHERYQDCYPKVLYLVRDGRDVMASYYNYQQTVRGYKGSFADFFRQALSGHGIRFGAWHEHVKSWMLQSHPIPIPFASLCYEQLHRDPYETLQRVVDFLKLDANECQIHKAYEACTFERHIEDVVRNSPHRKTGYKGGIKGGPGAWKNIFTEDMNDRFWQVSGEVMEFLGYPRE